MAKAPKKPKGSKNQLLQQLIKKKVAQKVGKVPKIKPVRVAGALKKFKPKNFYG